METILNVAGLIKISALYFSHSQMTFLIYNYIFIMALMFFLAPFKTSFFAMACLVTWNASAVVYLGPTIILKGVIHP